MVLPPKVIHPKGDTELSLKKREINNSDYIASQ